jgi:sodium pump decarboxylase gamma subunit
MKQKIKGLLLVLCMVFAMTGLTGCGTQTELKDDVTTLTEDDVTSYETSASQLIQQVVAFTDDEIEQYLSLYTDDFSINTLEGWKSVKDELGEFQEITEQAVVEDGDEITITSRTTFANATADIDFVINVSSQSAESMTFTVNYSMADTMKQAGLNTLMGIGIVFCMLVFLSFLISQFKHIAKLEAKLAAKKEKEELPKMVSVPEEVEAFEEEELADDTELVAVIAAAIATYENTSTDSFVVRSIKKSNSRKWKRA